MTPATRLGQKWWAQNVMRWFPSGCEHSALQIFRVCLSHRHPMLPLVVRMTVGCCPINLLSVNLSASAARVAFAVIYALDDRAHEFGDRTSANGRATTFTHAWPIFGSVILFVRRTGFRTYSETRNSLIYSHSNDAYPVPTNSYEQSFETRQYTDMTVLRSLPCTSVHILERADQLWWHPATKRMADNVRFVCGT